LPIKNVGHLFLTQRFRTGGCLREKGSAICWGEPAGSANGFSFARPATAARSTSRVWRRVNSGWSTERRGKPI